MTEEKQAETNSPKWQFPVTSNVFFDPLLDSLEILTRLHGTPHSAESLKAGMPLVDNKFTFDVFIRAARRAGLSSRLLKRKLKDLSSLTTPCVLILTEQRACVLTDIDHEQSQATVIFPDSGDGSLSIPLAELEEYYDSHILLAKPVYRFEDRAEKSIALESEHWFWGTLMMSWRIYRDVLLASVLINMFALVTPLFTRNVYDRVVPNSAIDTMWALAIGALVVFSFDIIMKMTRTYFLDLAGKKADLLLSAKLFAQVLGMRFEGRPASVGTFSKNVQEFEVVRDFITSATMATLVDLPFVMIFLTVIWILSGNLVWVPVTGIVIILLSGFIFHPLMKEATEKSARASSQKNGLLIEAIGGLESVKATSAESSMQSRWEAAVSYISECNIRSRLLSTASGSIGSYINQICTVGLIIFGVYMIKDGDMTMGGLIAAMMLSGRAVGPVMKIANLTTRFNSARTAYSSLVSIMELEQERPADKKFLQVEKIEGEIDFKKVDFSYPQAEFLALSDVSFKISPGDRVGVIGRLGSGKSTIAKLLMNLYRPAKGRIEVDSIDLGQLNPADLRRHIGVVTQDQTLFYGTLRENIVMGVPHVEDNTMLRAVHLSGVMDFANSHPDGLDMQVGERGQMLSGGQRQCVLLARAFLLDPPILLFDEPTSAMDNSSEQRFLQRLVTILPNKTLIFITHKTALLRVVDKLIVMDQGQVVTQGSKDEVFARLQGNKVSQGEQSHA